MKLKNFMTGLFDNRKLLEFLLEERRTDLNFTSINKVLINYIVKMSRIRQSLTG